MTLLADRHHFWGGRADYPQRSSVSSWQYDGDAFRLKWSEQERRTRLSYEETVQEDGFANFSGVFHEGGKFVSNQTDRVVRFSDRSLRFLDTATGETKGADIKTDFDFELGTIEDVRFASQGIERILIVRSGIFGRTGAVGDGGGGLGEMPGTVRIWNGSTGEPVTAPIRVTHLKARALFTPNGKWIVATHDGPPSARTWDAETRKPVCPPMQHNARVNDLALSSNGLFLATCSADGTARVWDLATGQPVTLPLLHPANVLSVNFSPDGDSLLSICADDVVRLWKLNLDSPPSDLATYAWLVAGSYVDETGTIVPIETDELRSLIEQTTHPHCTRFSASCLLRQTAMRHVFYLRVGFVCGRLPCFV